MSLLTPDYVVIKIDTDVMEHGAEVAKRLRGDRDNGIPWMVILDADGQELISADGPQGNIGCPIDPDGIVHFMNMLEQTSRHSGPETRAQLRAALEEFARPYQEKLGITPPS
jgi:hypothetical protein